MTETNSVRNEFRELIENVKNRRTRRVMIGCFWQTVYEYLYVLLWGSLSLCVYGITSQGVSDVFAESFTVGELIIVKLMIALFWLACLGVLVVLISIVHRDNASRIWKRDVARYKKEGYRDELVKLGIIDEE